jgi:hypothetical protein
MVGAGRIVAYRKRRNREKLFDHSFEQIDLTNQTLSPSLFVSADVDSSNGIIPFKLIEFDQNSKENSPTTYLSKPYVIILVVASAFFLCILCNMVEKNPKRNKNKENVVEIQIVDTSKSEIPKR